MGKLHFLQHIADDMGVGKVEIGNRHSILVSESIIVDLHHLVGTKLLAHHREHISQSRDVFRVQAVGMHTDMARMLHSHLMHEMRKVDNSGIVALAITISSHHLLVFAKISGKDAHGIIFIYHGTFCRQESLLI